MFPILVKPRYIDLDAPSGVDLDESPPILFKKPAVTVKKLAVSTVILDKKPPVVPPIMVNIPHYRIIPKAIRKRRIFSVLKNQTPTGRQHDKNKIDRLRGLNCNLQTRIALLDTITNTDKIM